MSAHKQCKSKNGFQLRSVQPEQIIIQKACAIPLQLFEVLENFAQASFCSVEFANIRMPFSQLLQNALRCDFYWRHSHVYMSVTVSYKHLARGLEIVSVAIPMTSSCSIYLDNNGSEFLIQAASNSLLHLW